MSIKSPEVLLRPFTLDDVDAFYQIAHNREVKQFVPYAYTGFRRTAKELIRNYITYDFTNDFYYAICKSDTNELIGAILAYRLPNTKILDTSYFIGKEHRGKSYMMKALRLFISHIAKETNYDYLRFVVSPYNKISLGIMFELGLADNGDEMVYFYPLKWNRK